MEDEGAARLVERARIEVAAGAPLLPKLYVDRLAEGDNPVRVLREWRDMTQLHLSFKRDSVRVISPTSIWTPERNGGGLRRIADVLKVPLDLLSGNNARATLGRHGIRPAVPRRCAC